MDAEESRHPYYVRRKVMRRRYFRYGVILVLIIILLFGYRVFTQNTADKEQYYPRDVFPFEYDEVRDIIRKMIERHKKIEKEFFDSIFGDDFFDRKYDPFREIERFRERMMRMFSDEEKRIFVDGFDNWFEKRIKLDDIKIKKFDDRIEIYIDKIKEKNVTLNIKDDYIKISYDVVYSDMRKKSNRSSESVYRTERYIKYIKLGEEFRNKHHSVELLDDRIVIKFFENNK